MASDICQNLRAKEVGQHWANRRKVHDAMVCDHAKAHTACGESEFRDIVELKEHDTKLTSSLNVIMKRSQTEWNNRRVCAKQKDIM